MVDQLKTAALEIGAFLPQAQIGILGLCSHINTHRAGHAVTTTEIAAGKGMGIDVMRACRRR